MNIGILEKQKDLRGFQASWAQRGPAQKGCGDTEAEATERKRLQNTVQKTKVPSAHVCKAAPGRLSVWSGNGTSTAMSGDRCRSPLLAELMNYTTHFHLVT